MRTLMVVLALVAVAGAGCAGGLYAKVQYLAAYNTFRDAVLASAVEGKPVAQFASEVAQATSRFHGDLRAIAFPDAARADAETLIEEAAELERLCSVASTATDPAAMPA